MRLELIDCTPNLEAVEVDIETSDISWTLLVEGVSIACVHKLLEKSSIKIVPSKEYVGDTLRFHIPEDISRDERLRSMYIVQYENSYSTYKLLVNKLIDKYLNEGMDIEEAIEVASKYASYSLPISTYVDIELKITLPSLLELVEESNHVEVTAVVDEILKFISINTPEYYYWLSMSYLF